MKFEEFFKTMSEMENFYGKEMTEEQKKIWYDNLKTMDYTRFNYIVANLYKTSKFIPKLADIYEINMTLEQINDVSQETKKDCKKCNNSGYIIFTQMIEDYPYQYAAICGCGRKKQYVGWNLSDEKKKNKYYIPFDAQIGI